MFLKSCPGEHVLVVSCSPLLRVYPSQGEPEGFGWERLDKLRHGHQAKGWPTLGFAKFQRLN